MICSFARLALLLALLSSAARAQAPCHAENDGNGYNDMVSMNDGLLLAVRFTPPTDFTCDRIEVFTGDVSGSSAVAIWSKNPVFNQPGTELSSGLWVMSNVASWQGASLSQPVPLSAGTDYWMVWTVIGGCQASLEVPTTADGQYFGWTYDYGNVWHVAQDSSMHWKFRLFGNCSAVAPGGFCFGDGAQTTCPCANGGFPGRGCDNSLTTGGVRLSTAGTTVPDTLVLRSAGGHPSALSIFLQGSTSSAAAPFGDGLLCIGGALKRLYAKNALEGNSSAPVASELSITARSAELGDPIAPGSSRYYQVYYRDPNLTFCPMPAGDSWNASSAVQVDW